MRDHAPLILVVLGLLAACGSSTGTSTTSGAGGTSSSTTSSPSSTGAGTTTQASSTSASSSTSTTSSGGSSNYSCTVKSSALHFCSLYLDPTPDELTMDQGDCAQLGGTSGTSCAQTSAIGTCSTDYGSETWYSDGGTTAAEAQMSCTDSNGTWTPA